MKIISITFLLALLAGCANSNTSDKTAQTEDDGMICKMERTTGSNIATRVCRTPEQIAYQEKMAKEAMKDMQRGAVKIEQ